MWTALRVFFNKNHLKSEVGLIRGLRDATFNKVKSQSQSFAVSEASVAGSLQVWERSRDEEHLPAT